MKVQDFPAVMFAAGSPAQDAAYLELVGEHNQTLWDAFVSTRFGALNNVRGSGVKAARRRLRRAMAALYRRHEGLLQQRAAEFQAAWQPSNDRWMKTLVEVLAVPWQGSQRSFQAEVIFSPLCPRNVELCTFALPHFLSIPEMIRVCAHETTHFLYFAKLQALGFEVTATSVNFPSRQWLLSEIIAPVLMNDPRVRAVIGDSKITSYVCTEQFSLYVAELYHSCVQAGRSFEDFFRRVLALELTHEQIAAGFRECVCLEKEPPNV